MAGATTFAPLHLRHAEVRIVTNSSKEFVMAICAGIHLQMLAMAENKVPEIRNFDGNVTGRMAFGAVVKLYPVGTAGVGMTGATRFSLFHVCHGIHRIFFAHHMINGIVAGRAIVIQLLEVTLVLKGNLSCLSGSKIERIINICPNTCCRLYQQCCKHQQYHPDHVILPPHVYQLSHPKFTTKHS